MARLTTEAAGGANVRAFLDVIAHAEGVERFSVEGGYDVLVGGGRFTGYAQHPKRRVFLKRYGLRSTAAGRYQFLARTWQVLQRRLRLPDFGPESQDRAAIELIRERGALADVQAGRIEDALVKVRSIWASLPGAGYGQRELAREELLAVYLAAGGRLA